MIIHPHTETIDGVSYLTCNRCGTRCSSGFVPLSVEGFIHLPVVRAWIECPECMEKENAKRTFAPLQSPPWPVKL